MSDQPSTDDLTEEGKDAQVAARRLGGGRMAAGMPVEKSKNFKGTVGRLLRAMAPERLGVITMLTATFVSVVLAIIVPQKLGDATDVIVRGVFNPVGGVDFDDLTHVLVVTSVLVVGSAVLSWLQGYFLAGVVQRTMERVRNDVEAKMHRLSLSYVDSQPRGDLLSRVTNDLDNVAQSLQQSLSQILTSVLTIIGVVVMMYTISPLLATIALVTIPTSLAVVKLVGSRSKKHFINQWTHTGMLNAQVEEAFTGHALVKVFGQTDASRERFKARNDQLYEAGFKAGFIAGTIQPAMMFLGNFNFVAIAVIGGMQITSGALTIGGIQAFIQYSRRFTQPLTQLASMMTVVQSGIASAERVFELLDVPEQAPEPDIPLRVDAARGHIAFDRVSFSYQPDKPLIEDLSMVARPGHTIAIVGPTGAGKTTLVNLIMRFYEVDKGTITLDGVDIAKMRRDELRSNIGMVLQDTWLFEGTIAENIAYGRPDATFDEVLVAAKACYVDRFVHSLADGYNTIVDDEGGIVSAGEKQLITIARAFLASPTILILDEATSSVDTRTEVLIQKAMAALRANRTSFVIAHRLSTIRDADHILVMEAGHIVEQGNHEQLLAAGGAYYNLYNAQFSGPATDDI